MEKGNTKSPVEKNIQKIGTMPHKLRDSSYLSIALTPTLTSNTDMYNDIISKLQTHLRSDYSKPNDRVLPYSHYFHIRKLQTSCPNETVNADLFCYVNRDLNVNTNTINRSNLQNNDNEHNYNIVMEAIPHQYSQFATINLQSSQFNKDYCTGVPNLDHKYHKSSNINRQQMSKHNKIVKTTSINPYNNKYRNIDVNPKSRKNQSVESLFKFPQLARVPTARKQITKPQPKTQHRSKQRECHNKLFRHLQPQSNLQSQQQYFRIDQSPPIPTHHPRPQLPPSSTLINQSSESAYPNKQWQSHQFQLQQQQYQQQQQQQAGQQGGQPEHDLGSADAQQDDNYFDVRVKQDQSSCSQSDEQQSVHYLHHQQQPIVQQYYLQQQQLGNLPSYQFQHQIYPYKPQQSSIQVQLSPLEKVSDGSEQNEVVIDPHQKRETEHKQIQNLGSFHIDQSDLQNTSSPSASSQFPQSWQQTPPAPSLPSAQSPLDQFIAKYYQKMTVQQYKPKTAQQYYHFVIKLPDFGVGGYNQLMGLNDLTCYEIEQDDEETQNISHYHDITNLADESSLSESLSNYTVIQSSNSQNQSEQSSYDSTQSDSQESSSSSSQQKSQCQIINLQSQNSNQQLEDRRKIRIRDTKYKVGDKNSKKIKHKQKRNNNKIKSKKQRKIQKKRLKKLTKQKQKLAYRQRLGVDRLTSFPVKLSKNQSQINRPLNKTTNKSNLSPFGELRAKNKLQHDLSFPYKQRPAEQSQIISSRQVAPQTSSLPKKSALSLTKFFETIQKNRQDRGYIPKVKKKNKAPPGMIPMLQKYDEAKYRHEPVIPGYNNNDIEYFSRLQSKKKKNKSKTAKRQFLKQFKIQMKAGINKSNQLDSRQAYKRTIQSLEQRAQAIARKPIETEEINLEQQSDLRFHNQKNKIKEINKISESSRIYEPHKKQNKNQSHKIIIKRIHVQSDPHTKPKNKKITESQVSKLSQASLLNLGSQNDKNPQPNLNRSDNKNKNQPLMPITSFLHRLQKVIQQTLHRPQKLEQLALGSHRRSQLLSCLLFNNLYFQNLDVKLPQAPRVPFIFRTFEEYQRVFMANIRNQMYSQLREKISCIMQGDKFQFDNRDQRQNNRNQDKYQGKKYKPLYPLIVRSQQKLQREGLFQLEAIIDVQSYKNGNIRNSQNTQTIHEQSNSSADYSRKTPNPNRKTSSTIQSLHKKIKSQSSIYKNKHRIFLLVCSIRNRDRYESFCVLCQVRDIGAESIFDRRGSKRGPVNRNDSVYGRLRNYGDDGQMHMREEFVVRITIGVDISSIINKYRANQFNDGSFMEFSAMLYDLQKMTTPARQYQAISNAKHNQLIKQIMDPSTPQKPSRSPINPSLSTLTNLMKDTLQNLCISTFKCLKPFFNSTQLEAIRKISISGGGIELLQGPPGTGKTSTLMGLLSCEFRKLQFYNYIVQLIGRYRQGKGKIMNDYRKFNGLRDNKDNNRMKNYNLRGSNVSNNSIFVQMQQEQEEQNQMLCTNPQFIKLLQSLQLEQGVKCQQSSNEQKQKKIPPKEPKKLKILICTPSNSAIDLITNKIIEQGLFCCSQFHSGLPNATGANQDKVILQQLLTKWKTSNEQLSCNAEGLSQRERDDQSQTPIAQIQPELDLEMVRFNYNSNIGNFSKLQWTGLTRYRQTINKNTMGGHLKYTNIYNHLNENSYNRQDTQIPKFTNYYNRKFPRILRIGTSDSPSPASSQYHTNSSINTTYLQNLLVPNLPFQPPKYLFPSPQNYNITYHIDRLFERENRIGVKVLNRGEIQRKIGQVDRDIRLCWDVAKALVGQYERSWGAEYNKICNHLLNMIQVKSTIASTLQSILATSQPPQLKQLTKSLEQALIHSSQIILTTLTSSHSEKLLQANPRFITLFVDEAAQCTEPNMMIPLLYGIGKVVLVGDQCQLPATVGGGVGIGYERSFFERLWICRKNSLNINQRETQLTTRAPNPTPRQCHILTTQHRMNPQIRQFPSQAFYNNQLIDSPAIQSRPEKDPCYHYCAQVLNLGEVTFVDCLTGLEERVGNSYVNRVEGDCIVGVLGAISGLGGIEGVRDGQGDRRLSIGVITPYSQQQKYIKKLLLKPNSKTPTITVSTVDSYQGQQRDIIIISTVRSNNKGIVGFLSDQRRINVALTRAKYAVIVLGNSKTLGRCQVWANYMRWVKQWAKWVQFGSRVEFQAILGDIVGSDKEEFKRHLRDQYEHKLSSFPLQTQTLKSKPNSNLLAVGQQSRPINLENIQKQTNSKSGARRQTKKAQNKLKPQSKQTRQLWDLRYPNSPAQMSENDNQREQARSPEYQQFGKRVIYEGWDGWGNHNRSNQDQIHSQMQRNNTLIPIDRRVPYNQNIEY